MANACRASLEPRRPVPRDAAFSRGGLSIVQRGEFWRKTRVTEDHRRPANLLKNYTRSAFPRNIITRSFASLTADPRGNKRRTVALRNGPRTLPTAERSKRGENSRESPNKSRRSLSIHRSTRARYPGSCWNIAEPPSPPARTALQ